MTSLDQVPEGPMRDALAAQEPAFRDEMIRRYLDGDAADRADMEAFFESEGPRRVHEDGVPTSEEISRGFKS